MMDLVGENFSVPHLAEFSTWWVSLFIAPKPVYCGGGKPVDQMPGYSPTRWWSKWELINQVMELFGLRRNEDLAPATRARLLDYFNDAQKNAYLQIEMAIVIDISVHFVKATYNLEGVGPLTLTCYEVITALSVAVNQVHYPNTQAVVKRLTTDPAQQQVLEMW